MLYLPTLIRKLTNTLAPTSTQAQINLLNYSESTTNQTVPQDWLRIDLLTQTNSCPRYQPILPRPALTSPSRSEFLQKVCDSKKENYKNNTKSKAFEAARLAVDSGYYLDALDIPGINSMMIFSTLFEETPVIGSVANALLALLLYLGISPNSHVGTPDTERSALGNAITFGNKAALKQLLEAGADPNRVAIEVTQNIPLLLAIHLENLEMARMLLDAGANPNLHLRLANGAISSLLDTVYEANLDGTLLLLNYSIKNTKPLNLLNKHNMTHLYMVAYQGDIEKAAILLEHGANPNIQNPNGFTPLYTAVFEGRTELVRLLLAHGANQTLAQKAAQSQSMQEIARELGHTQVLDLLKACDSPDDKDEHGFSRLYKAVYSGDIRSAELLLSCGANPNQAIQDEYTPLYAATFEGNLAMVKRLRCHGADPKLAERNGVSMLSLAEERKHKHLVDFYRADPSIPTNFI